ncbi:HNH endonuclease signature motif containing protein [Microbacterium sp.]|uniref:HNH endonuclease signature motif containing protein n=1 Tax=Microbacterium sp. TaxID=51671 RepID=UPI000928F4D5|nr:HNH endonuclease signature motif containing protein [Microbacterium sp.]MBN9194223.1 DUF222 domain-containing protein [Microbacterium sp.]OJU68557.1 MAG: hypothetical protein BGO04_06215 [Microbacterium sp. 70-38]
MSKPPVIAPVASATVDAIVADVVALRRSMAALQAREARLLATAFTAVRAEAGGARPGSVEAELPVRSLAAELGAALRVSDRSVQRQLGEAVTLTERFPATFAALAAGRVSRAHVAVIMDAGAHLTDPEARAVFEAAVLPYAEAESASRLKPVARVRAEKVVPSSLQERHDRARARRGVRVNDLDDGMSELTAVLPAVLAHGCYDRLTRMAHEVRAVERDGQAVAGGATGGSGTNLAADAAPLTGAATDPPGDAAPTARSMDELRADILADLLLTGAPEAHDGPTGLAAIHATVEVTVPVLTLLGQDAGPVDLAGYGPIDPATARHLAGHAPGWDRILTHPVTGAVLAVDRYRPSEQIRRALRVRDRHCRFPGCRQPTWRCDIDHTHDAAHGGKTRICNLAHLCRRHHILKHHTAWCVTQLADGVLQWTSPTGRIYRDVPVSSVAFSSVDSLDRDPPPF